MARSNGAVGWGASLIGLIAYGGLSLYANTQDALPPEGHDPADRTWSQGGEPKSGRSNVSYGRCADAHAAGVTPLYRGQPGYDSHLDRDDDGIACEPYHGR